MLSRIRDEVIKNGREGCEDFEKAQQELFRLILSERGAAAELKAGGKKEA